MNESERLQRYRQEKDSVWADENDSNLADRIAKLLNHPQIDKYCMVDASYYDFSVIPYDIQQKNQFWRDMYFLFGITTEGEMITKWVERYDLDSSDPIVDGKVIYSDKPCNNTLAPEIRQRFDSKLLSTPSLDLMKLFNK